MANVCQVHECLEVGANVPFSTSKEHLSARASRYESYLDEVREWRMLPGGAITLAAPVPLKGMVVQKGRVTSARRPRSPRKASEQAAARTLRPLTARLRPALEVRTG